MKGVAEMKVFLSPEGNLIVGTLETVPGVAVIDMDSARIENGKLEFDYAGQTDLWWDDQSTQRKKGKRLFVDDEGKSFTEDQIYFIDPDNGITEQTLAFPYLAEGLKLSNHLTDLHSD
jgi:hypothetical protein